MHGSIMCNLKALGGVLIGSKCMSLQVPSSWLFPAKYTKISHKGYASKNTVSLMGEIELQSVLSGT